MGRNKRVTKKNNIHCHMCQTKWLKCQNSRSCRSEKWLYNSITKIDIPKKTAYDRNIDHLCRNWRFLRTGCTLKGNLEIVKQLKSQKEIVTVQKSEKSKAGCRDILVQSRHSKKKKPWNWKLSIVWSEKLLSFIWGKTTNIFIIIFYKEESHG